MPSNSRIGDAFVAVCCLTGDTQVSLLNGTEIPIKDLVGLKEFWVYSYDINRNEIVPSKGYNCQMLRKNVSILKIILDNNDIIKCTLDHEILMRNGNYKKSDKLKLGDSLMPLYRRINNGYEEIKNSTSKRNGRWVHTHKLVYKWKYGDDIKKYKITHHKDLNYRNNNPANILSINSSNHSKYHRTINNPMFNIQSNIKRGFDKIMFDRMKQKNPMYNKESFNKMIDHHPMKNKNTRKKVSNGVNKLYDNGSILRNRIKNVIQKVLTLNLKLTEDNYNNLKGGGVPCYNKVTKYFSSIENAIEYTKTYNHKIKSIQYLNEKEDTYCFTVDRYHNFALTSGIFVKNCCHPPIPCIATAGVIVTGSGDHTVDGSAQARTGDIGVAFCGHLTVIVSGSGQSDTNGRGKARAGDPVAACPVGAIVSGTGKEDTG